MPKTQKRSLASIDSALAHRAPFDQLLAKLGARDRLNVDRHVAACDEEHTSDHRQLWQRVACSLHTLAPHALQTSGQQAMQFFIADGKYRMQVFALEDQRQGHVLVYAVDVLDMAIKAGILSAAKANGAISEYPIRGSDGQLLTIESLDAVNTPNPSPWYKHMLGWNRKAIRISLPTNATEEQIKAAESLCVIAAQEWAG
jgi:hypothetical protein